MCFAATVSWGKQIISTKPQNFWCFHIYGRVFAQYVLWVNHLMVIFQYFTIPKLLINEKISQPTEWKPLNYKTFWFSSISYGRSDSTEKKIAYLTATPPYRLIFFPEK